MNPAARSRDRDTDDTRDSGGHQAALDSQRPAPASEARIARVRLGRNPVFRTVLGNRWAALAPAGCLATWGLLTLASVPSAAARGVLALPAFAALQVAGLLAAKVSANSRMFVTRELQTRFAVADRQVLSAAHGELASLTRSVDQSRSALARSTDHGATEVQPLLDDVLAACQRARRQDPSSAFPDIPDPSDASSSVLVDRWARLERTPAWWPMSLRELWATTAASWLDSVRLLHTREIERVALAGTLVLRASFVVTAPVAGALTIGGIVPFGAHIVQWRDVLWGVAAIWSGLAALAAPWVVSRIIDHRGSQAREMLLVCESIIAIGVLMAVPSWMTFAFVAGPLNWAMRPRWRSRLLALATAGFAAAFATGLLLAPGGAGGGKLGLEIAIGLACIGLISNSFGLLLPIVVAHVLFVLPAWHRKAKRFRRRQWRERAEPIVVALETALQKAERDGHGSPAVAETAAQLRRAQLHLHRLLVFPQSRHALVRRRTLLQIIQAVLDRAASDPARPLRTAAPSFSPPELAQTGLASWRVANHLEIALSRISSEALRHGEFEIRCTCRVAGTDIVVRVENDVAPGSSHVVGDGRGRGSREITAALAQLPDGRLLRRGTTTGVSGIPVFVVEFSFRHSGRKQ